MKRVVVISGAGISAESGLKTFPCADGFYAKAKREDAGPGTAPRPSLPL